MRLWLSVVLLIAVALASLMSTRLPVQRESGTFPTNPRTPYDHYQPVSSPRGRVLVVHGLDANKEIMSLLSYALAESGFEVFAVDLPGHGSSAASFDAFLARQVVSDVMDQLGPETIAIGHSMGSALLLDLAHERPFGTLVLFSPAPIPVEHIQAGRLLVFTGQFDLPAIVAFVPQLRDVGAGSSDLRVVPWAGHSGHLFRPAVLKETVEWLGGDSSKIRAGQRLGLFMLMMCGTLALPLLWMSASRVEAGRAPLAVPLLLVLYIAAALAAAGMLRFVAVTGWLHLFGTGYLVGFVFLAGIVLAARYRPHDFGMTPLVRSTLVAAYMILVPGMLVASKFVHLTLSDGRWWRFLAIAALGLPLFAADEVLLRPLRPWWKAAIVAGLSRVLLGALLVDAVMVLNREAAVLVLIIHLIVVFWMALWFLAGRVRVWTGSALAAALFSSWIQAWVFATLFVIGK